MRKIQECFKDSISIVEYINNSQDPMNEGLADRLKSVKAKLGKLASKVVAWAKGLVAQVQYWFMLTNEDGEILPCSTPLTMGNAYKSGLINKSSTFIGMGKDTGRLVGTSESFSNAKNLYPSTKEWWAWLKANHRVSEHNEEEFIQSLCESNPEDFNYILNEVKLANEDPQAKYNVIVDNKKLRQLIKRHINSKKLARLLIWGAPGIGKTAILMNIVDEISAEQGKDFNLIVKTLSNETPDNFMLPKYVGDRADDVPKTWLPVYRPTGDAAADAEADAKCGRGLLFIDELSRATQQVQNVVLPLVNEGVFNGWKLGSGWSIICASNRDEDEDRGGQTSIGNALGNRFAQVYYEPCCNTWREWADKQGFMSPLLTQWLSMPEGETLAGGKYYYWDPNGEDADMDPTHIMCSPRSWTNAMRDLAEYHNTGKLEGFNIFDIDEFDLKFVLNQYVPAAAVDAFWAFLQTISRIGDFDAAVESAWRNNGSGLNIAPKDLIKVAMPLAQLVVCAHKDTLPTAKEFESLANWLVAANNEQLASYTLDVFKNVYGANIPDSDSSIGLKDMKSYIFLLKKMNDRKPEIWNNIHAFDAFMDAWGIDRKTMPDYSKGLSIIAKKYGEAFKLASVDGRDGLG